MKLQADQIDYIFLSSDRDEVMGKVRGQVDDFFAKNDHNARVISFFEATRLKLPEMTNIEFWRDLVSSSEEKRFQLEAHKRLEKLLALEFLQDKNVLACNWSLLFVYMYQCVVVDDLLNNRTGPLCLVLSGGGANGDFFTLSTRSGQRVPEVGLRANLQRLELDEVTPEQIQENRSSAQKYDLLVLEDTGSRLNLDPALTICQQISGNGHVPYVLTSSQPVLVAMEKNNIPVRMVRFDDLPPEKMNELQNQAIDIVEHLERFEGIDRVDEMFISTIHSKLHSWLRDVELLEQACSNLFATSNIEAMLSIGPPVPLNIVAGQNWRVMGGKWINYLPALINPSIEDRFFPADRYLVYGTHASDIIDLSDGAPKTVVPVGSIGLDRVVNERRQKPVDRNAVEKDFPFITGKKFVVLGTERRPGELKEIVQILEEVAKIPDVCVLVKVHPDQSPKPFEVAVANIAPDRMQVVHHCDLHQLLNGADLLLCSASNINLLAAVLNTPTLVITLSGQPYRVDFPAEGLCPQVKHRMEISSSVYDLLFDQESINKSMAMYKTAINRFNQYCDGETKTRILHEIMKQKQIHPWKKLIAFVSKTFNSV